MQTITISRKLFDEALDQLNRAQEDSYAHTTQNVIDGLEIALRQPVTPAVFTDKEQLAEFIQVNIPIWVKPTKKSKTVFVGVFTSNNAMKETVEALTDKLWEKLTQNNPT